MSQNSTECNSPFHNMNFQNDDQQRKQFDQIPARLPQSIKTSPHFLEQKQNFINVQRPKPDLMTTKSNLNVQSQSNFISGL